MPPRTAPVRCESRSKRLVRARESEFLEFTDMEDPPGHKECQRGTTGITASPWAVCARRRALQASGVDSGPPRVRMAINIRRAGELRCIVSNFREWWRESQV